MAHDLATVADEDVLDCGTCFRPLKPPIFQCAVGHALCSSCSEKLRHTSRCYLCRVWMPGSYQRCHAMERVVDSIVCGPCPHVPYGCGADARLLYNARDEHILRCPHAPCHCPGEGCCFVGSVTVLVEHLVAAHSWPCTAEPSASESFGVDLRAGFNFLTAVRGSGAEYLLLLVMENTPLVHMISAVWIRSVPGTSLAPAATKTICDLELRCRRDRSRFQLQCTSPSNYYLPPAPKASFNRFFFPSFRQATVHVKAVISIKSS